MTGPGTCSTTSTYHSTRIRSSHRSSPVKSLKSRLTSILDRPQLTAKLAASGKMDFCIAGLHSIGS